MAKVKGIPQLKRRLEAVGGPNVDATILRNWQTRTVMYAKVNAPKRSGHLKQSIHAGIRTMDKAQVEASAPYAWYVEGGTKPHLILPVKGRFLAWNNTPGATRLTGSLRSGVRPNVFARKVNHPGTKPHPFLMPAAQRALTELNLGDVVIKAWNDAS